MVEFMDKLPGVHNYTFKTERLFCRPLRHDDVDAVFALKSDPQVFYWAEPIKHEAQAKEWIRARLESGYYLSFCVEELPSSEDGEIHKEKPEVIGMAGGTFLPEIGYMFRPAYWGRGYATEAVNGFMKFYWETFPEGHPTIADAEEKEYLKAMTGPPDEAPQSRASIAVLKKSGFEFWKEKDEYHELLEMKIRLLIWRRWGPGYGP